jgi:hypothetical protein
MEKKRLKLSQLKVQSFVTKLENNESRTVQGGAQSDNPACNSEVAACINTQAYLCPINPSAYDACPTVFSCGACTHTCI